jgi:molybdate transport system permease protein
MTRRGRALPVAALLVLACASWRARPAEGEDPPLRLLAAASLTDVVVELVAGLDEAVDTSFGATSALARQIRDGAPADVFLAASPEWMAFLREADALAAEPIVIARNRLAAVAPAGSRLAGAGVAESPGSLLAALGPAGRVAIADLGVPAGESARAALEHLDLLDGYRPHLVGQRNVRAALAAVERGELDAGFVYATDARVGRVDVLFTFDPATHRPIEYQAAVLRGAPSPERARRLLEHLGSPAARAALAAAGFEPLAGSVAQTPALELPPPEAPRLGSIEPSAAEIGTVLLSLRVALGAVAVSLVPGILVGWLLARWRHPLRALLQGLVMLPLVLPPVVTGLLLLWGLGRSSALGRAWQALTGGQLAYTTSACVVAAAVVGFPLLVEAIRLAVLGVDRRLEQVARSLGRGPVDTFARVTLPLALPGIAAGAVLSFARALGEFGATIVIAGNVAGETRTIPVAVYTLLDVRGGEPAAARLVAISVSLSLLALLGSFWLSARRREER